MFVPSLPKTRSQGTVGMGDQKDYATKEDLKNLKEDVRADLKDFKEEIIHRFHIISEDHLAQIKQLSEGITNLYEKSERDKAELKSEIREGRQEILARHQIFLCRTGQTFDNPRK